jgi:group I intron endonuclease
MENIYYVYIYLDPIKNGKFAFEGLDQSFLYEPFYVGKGKDSRITSHLHEYRLRKKTHMSNKLNKIINQGMSPIIIKLYDNLSEEESLNKEIEIIYKLGIKNEKKGPLVNVTYGGQGVSGLKHTEESRKKMSLKGEDHPNWGKHLKESTRKKISEKLKKNNGMKNPEVVEKVRQKNLGKPAWNKGLKTPEEICKKLSEKKIKYRDIEIVDKNTGEKLVFPTTKELMDFLGKCHRSVLNYLVKGESKDYFIKPQNN